MGDLIGNGHVYHMKLANSDPDKQELPSSKCRLLDDTENLHATSGIDAEKHKSPSEGSRFFFGDNEKSQDLCEKSMDYPSEKRKIVNTKMQRFMCALMFVNGAICLATLGLTVFFLVQEESTLAQKQDFTRGVCLQCRKLITNSVISLEEDPLISKLMRRQENSIEMCCAVTSEQMSALLETVTKKKPIRPDPKPENTEPRFRFTPVVAHVGLLPYNDDNSAERGLTEPYFNNSTKLFAARFDTKFNDPYTELAQGITVEENDLVINHTGLYYVYLSVKMAPKFKKEAKLFKFQNWYQYVRRESKNNPANTGTLLQISHTAGKNHINPEETAYAGGTFYLSRDDKLKVCLNGLGLVEYTKESSFFGLVMLASGERQNGPYV